MCESIMLVIFYNKVLVINKYTMSFKAIRLVVLNIKQYVANIIGQIYGKQSVFRKKKGIIDFFLCVDLLTICLG